MQPRIFIAFPAEDRWARDRLVGQMRNQATPFEWTDLSMNEPWGRDWKCHCLTRIRGCHGMIAMIIRNTPHASGQLWEIETARAERLPLLAMHAAQDYRLAYAPPALEGVPVYDWTWRNSTFPGAAVTEAMAASNRSKRARRGVDGLVRGAQAGRTRG